VLFFAGFIYAQDNSSNAKASDEVAEEAPQQKESLTNRDYIYLGVALVAGGAMGALLKFAFDKHQSRIQPVGYRIAFSKVFKDTVGSSSLTAELQIHDGVETRHFHNLFIAEIILRNKGNADISEFNFGITLGGDDIAIYTESVSVDRHHTLERVSQVALGAAAKEIDFVCKPFNRKDTYSFKVFISIPTEKEEPEDITLSTAHPIKFVDLDSYQNTAVLILNAIFQGTAPTIGIRPVIEKQRVRSD
jgi:hypothetical protein